MMKKFTLLLIDDVPNNIYALKFIIESNFDNLDILTANSAHEAIKLIMQNEIDLILSDVQMPELSGLELATYLHETEQTKHIPIVLISATYKSEACIKKGYEVGVVDYISKPIDDEILCAKLRVFIDIYQNKRADKEELNKQEELLNEQSKVNSMISNLDKLSEINLVEYSDLVEHIEDDLIDLSNIENLKGKIKI